MPQVRRKCVGSAVVADGRSQVIFASYTKQL